MTYPPQGPQQGQPYGYGTPPGGYPQQQGSYPQQGGGYPPPGGGYPPQGGGGYQQYPGPPKKNNTALIATIAGVATAAVIALVLVLTLGGDDDKSTDNSADNSGGGNPTLQLPGPNNPSGGSTPRSTGGGGSGSGSGAGASSPQELGEKAVSIIESRSASQIDGLACTSSAASQLKRELAKIPAGADITATISNVTESGNTARIQIKLEMGTAKEGMTLEAAKQGSKWCTTGL